MMNHTQIDLDNSYNMVKTNDKNHLQTKVYEETNCYFNKSKKSKFDV